MRIVIYYVFAIFYIFILIVLLAKKYRVTWKDILFLTRKKQFFWYGMFWFFYFKQYESLHYNQLSCHITLKLSKKAIIRNVFKRAIINYVSDNNLIKRPFNKQFYKIFITLNKGRIQELQKKIANSSKKDNITYIKKEFETAWKNLIQKIK